MNDFRTLFAYILILLLCLGTNIYAKETDASSAKVLAAIEQLNAHVTEKKILDGKQITECTKIINDDAKVIGLDAEVMKACFSFVNNYDRTFKPLWIGRKGFGQSKNTDGEEIHWAVFWIMQNLIDYAYTAKNLMNHADFLAGARFGCADHFLGKVEETVAPNTIHVESEPHRT